MRDPIEREDVIKLVNRCKDRLQGKGLTYEIMLDMVQNIPSVDRPQGEWLERNSGFIEWIRCSVCNYRIYKGKKTNYCPNCGADMRKGADDE